MTAKTVTASEFRARAGVYLDDAARAPVIITKHDRPARVLVDVEEYERLVQAAGIREEETGSVSPEVERLIDQGRAAHRSTLDKLALE